MTTWINRALFLLKWPTAVLALLGLPSVILAWLWLASSLLSNVGSVLYFLLGVIGYWVLDKLVFGRKTVGSWFSTLEHEITHAIFAWATLHRVVGLRVTAHEGGHILYSGGSGNWLISIAPYWFPTLCIPIMLIAVLLDTPSAAWSGALGFAFMFHHISTWRETHTGQTDLQETTLLFAWMFLPFANLLAAGMVVAFAAGQTPLMWDFWNQFHTAFTSVTLFLGIAV